MKYATMHGKSLWVQFYMRTRRVKDTLTTAITFREIRGRLKKDMEDSVVLLNTDTKRTSKGNTIYRQMVEGLGVWF